MNSQTSNEMKKEYIKPEIEIEIIETEQLLAASETQIEKTEEPADEGLEVLSKEHHNSFGDE